jgi:methyl-accepting chemotaxis protein-1 (serine sensor receptor)
MFKNLTVKSRLIIVITFLLSAMLVVGGMGLFGMNKANEGLRTVYADRTVALGQVAHVQALILDERLQLSLAILNPTEAVIKRQTELVEKHIEDAGEVWAAYAGTYMTPEEKTLASKFEADHGHFVTEGLAFVIIFLREGRLDAAKLVNENKLDDLYAPVRDEIAALSKLQEDEAKAEYEAAQSRYATIRNISIGLILIATVIASLIGFVVTRSITRQIGGEPDYASAVVRQVAEGDLTVQVQVRVGDTTSLLASLKGMVNRLSELVSEVRGNTESITTASLEIAQGNADLSQRTEQQASSLEETASSMEELTSTVKQNTENARQANQLAASASDIAIKGGKVVGGVVHTMASISDSSKKIVDIISVIEGIAFQTNILALNAAVEAARAGEQGRGFAVVAGEVRNLAQRSAAAAKEIKTLIDDSVNKVDAGSKQVDQAGATMTEIVHAVKRVTDIMAEIAAASNEQSAGIEQVNQAITQMDDVTQQNAALVEEAAAAAEAMQEQAIALYEAVGVFRVIGGREAALSFAAKTADQNSSLSAIALRNANVTALPSSTMRAEDFGDIKEKIILARRAIMVMLQDKNKRGDYWQKLAQQSAETVSDSLSRVDAPIGKERQFKELSETWDAFKKTREEDLVPLLLDGKQAEAEKIAKGVQVERIKKIIGLCEELNG